MYAVNIFWQTDFRFCHVVQELNRYLLLMKSWTLEMEASAWFNSLMDAKIHPCTTNITPISRKLKRNSHKVDKGNKRTWVGLIITKTQQTQKHPIWNLTSQHPWSNVCSSYAKQSTINHEEHIPLRLIPQMILVRQLFANLYLFIVD